MSEEQPKDADDGIVDTRLAQLKARFGDRFDEAQWAAIRKSVVDLKQCSDRLRAVPMENGDEPEIVFVPFRADDPIWGAT
jgi:hypothetical protein